MLALVLVEAGLHPSFLIGADVNEIGTNAVWDAGEWLVLEADESYGTFDALRPEMAVVTSVEADHLDHYGTFEALRAAFERLLAGATGGAVVGADDPVAAELGRRPRTRDRGSDVAADVRLSSSAGAGPERRGLRPLRARRGRWAGLEVPMPGLHNARNAALAAAVALRVGVPFDERRRARWPASPGCPGGSSSGARPAG